jgi:hypothetical protein
MEQKYIEWAKKIDETNMKRQIDELKMQEDKRKQLIKNLNEQI